MMDSKERLGVVEFGQRLIETGDLDPLYIALYNAKFPRPKMCKWLVCYWCYYHAGLCCVASEQRNFFGFLLEVAQGGTKYPRGSERRHFRGNLAVDSVKRMAATFDSAEDIVDWLVAAGPSAAGIMKRVKTLHGFGEWISWKVPDMIERLGLAPVEFVEDDVRLMFKSSLDGAAEVAKRHGGTHAANPLLFAHRYLIRKLGRLEAPPSFDRRINVQETETVFCKWKSHLGGHYPLGKDSH